VGTFGGHRLFRLLAVCGALAAGCVGDAVSAATQSGTTKVVTLRPLSIVKIRDLEFGTLLAGTSSGTVVIDPTTDARTTTGGVTVAGGAPQAAQFLTYGTQGSILQVTRGALPVLTRAGGGATMSVTQLTLNGPTLRIVNPAGVLDLRVGGTLAVAANQMDGSYSGNFDIIVTYF
jgi:hypothetical protein